jgi:hypothetical protein
VVAVGTESNADTVKPDDVEGGGEEVGFISLSDQER